MSDNKNRDQHLRDTQDTSKAAQADGLDAPRRYWATLTLITAITITVLDASMSNVALPAIAQALNVNPADIVWVVIAYNLVVVVSLLPLSAVAERVGFRRMFATGLTVFMCASLAAASADSLPGLMIARIAQGMGTAMMMCLFGGLTRSIYPISRLGMGISINAMTVGIMSVLGPTLGAFILELASWQWVFLLTPFLCVFAYFGLRFLPDSQRTRVRFDWIACLLSIPVFGLTILGLDALVKYPARAALCLLCAALAAWVLVRRSSGQVAPIVPIDLLRITPIAYAVGASAFSFAAQMSAFVALPFYFRQTLGYSYAEVGLLLGAWSCGVAAMAPVAGYLSDRYRVAVLCGIGAASMATGLSGVILLPVNLPVAWFAAPMLLAGIGFGFFQTPNNRALLAGAPRHRAGAAGGMQATTRVLGQSLGTTMVGLSFSLSAEHGASLGVMVAIVCAFMAVLVNVFRLRSPVADMTL